MHPMFQELGEACEAVKTIQARIKEFRLGRIDPDHRFLAEGSILFTRKKGDLRPFFQIYVLRRQADLSERGNVHVENMEEGYMACLYVEEKTDHWCLGKDEWLWGIAKDLRSLVQEVFEEAVVPLLAEPCNLATALGELHAAEERREALTASLLSLCCPPLTDGLYETFGGTSVRVVGTGLSLVIPYAIPEDGSPEYALEKEKGVPFRTPQESPIDWFFRWSLAKKLDPS